MKKISKLKKKNRENRYYHSGRACPICGSTDTDTKCGAPCATLFCYKCRKVVDRKGYD